MWRIGVLIVATSLIEFAAAGVKPTDVDLLQRLKRSPNSCDNYEDYPQRRPRYWPPPPQSPPFWPPPPGPPPYWSHRRHRHRFDDFDDDLSRGEQLSDAVSRGERISDAASKGEPQEPCPKCAGGKGISSALSNAKSENGDAIAVAIAKASPKT